MYIVKVTVQVIASDQAAALKRLQDAIDPDPTGAAKNHMRIETTDSIKYIKD